MAWSDKDDAIDWQAYFHLRNRLVVAALHWDGNVTGLVRSHLKATLKHLACLEYSTVAIQNKAIDDFLAGPEHIFSILESALPDVHALRKTYPGRGGAAGGQRAARPVAARAGRCGRRCSPLSIGYRLARGIAAQPQGHRPRAPPAPAAQRADPGRPLVPAVHGRTASPSPPPTGAAWSTGSATGQDVRACCASRCAASTSWRAGSTRCAGPTAGALPALSSKQQWETVLLLADSACDHG